MRPLAPLILTLLLCALPATKAQAFEVGMQDDTIILHGVYNRDLALDQFVAMGGTNVRINVAHKEQKRFQNVIRYGLKYPLEQYDAAVDAVLDRGLDVQMTLIWNRRGDPAFQAAWMANVAEHFGDKVNRYSVLNEADISVPTDGSCNGVGQRALAKRYPGKMTVNDEGTLVAKGVLIKGENITLETACRQYLRGQNYRAIFVPAAKAIHKANPDAQVLAGETSATAGMEWFVRGALVKPLTGVDGWAHHPFQFRDLTPEKRANGWGIGNLKQFIAMVKMPVYCTEFGYPHPNSTMDKRVFGRRLKPSEIADVLPRSWIVARKAGVKQMLQYQWYKKPPFRTEYWDTSINNTDDGETTAAYKSLKKLILSWN